METEKNRNSLKGSEENRAHSRVGRSRSREGGRHLAQVGTSLVRPLAHGRSVDIARTDNDHRAVIVADPATIGHRCVFIASSIPIGYSRRSWRLSFSSPL